MSDVFAPSVGGDRRRVLVEKALWMHAAGGALGGSLLGAKVVLFRLSVSPAGAVFWLLACLGVAAAVVELLPPHLRRFPERSAQVPADWIGWGNLPKTAAAWGVMLGLGFLTGLVTPVYFALLFASSLQGPVLYAFIPPLLYGLARGMSVMGILWLRPGRNSEPGDLAEERAHRYLRRPLSVLAVSSLALVIALGPP